MRPTLFALAALTMISATPALADKETAVFAGGCFWCVESDMDKVKGVLSTTSGYAGGTKANPTYEDHEGYTEAVKIVFDNKVVTYDQLLGHFLRTIDVTDAGGQFCDRGSSYVSAIFATSPAQKKSADAAVAQAAKDLGQPIATPVRSKANFADAEDYHQDYYLGENRKLTRFGIVKQSEAYKGYRKACGRDARVKEVWGKAAYSFPVSGS
jgi:peptide-methionine (S)-S-oxide reductase